MVNLREGEGAGRADGEAVAKELTSLAKWSRVTAKASVLAVRELIVARRRSPGERGREDANTPGRSRRAGAAGSGRRVRWAGWQSGEGRGGSGLGVLLSRSFAGGAEGAGAARGRSRSRSAQAPRARLLYGPAAAPRVAVTSALSARSRILKHLRNAGWRGLLPSASPGSVAPFFFFFFFLVLDASRKQSPVFSTLNNDFYWRAGGDGGGRDEGGEFRTLLGLGGWEDLVGTNKSRFVW